MKSWRTRVAGAVFWTELLCGASVVAWLYVAGNPVAEARQTILLIASAITALAILFPALRPWPSLRQNLLWIVTLLVIEGVLIIQKTQSWQARTAWMDLAFVLAAVAACENRAGTIVAGLLCGVEVFLYERIFAGQTVFLSLAETVLTFALAAILIRSLQHQADIRRALGAEREKTRTDEMTGLLNTIAFEECRPGQNYALAICHIDHFKDINDTYGHQAGDNALAYVGNVLAQQCPDGMAYRLLGKEYVIVLPDQTVDELAERVKQAGKWLGERALRLGDGTTVPMTLSAGIGTGNARERAMDVKERTQSTLLAAKEMGGGHTRVAREVGTLATLRVG